MPSIKINLLPAYVVERRKVRALSILFSVVLVLLLAGLGAWSVKEKKALADLQKTAQEKQAEQDRVNKIKQEADAAEGKNAPYKNFVKFISDAHLSGHQRAQLLDDVRRYIFERVLITDLDVSDGQNVTMACATYSSDEFARFIQNIMRCPLFDNVVAEVNSVGVPDGGGGGMMGAGFGGGMMGSGFGGGMMSGGAMGAEPGMMGGAMGAEPGMMGGAMAGGSMMGGFGGGLGGGAQVNDPALQFRFSVRGRLVQRHALMIPQPGGQMVPLGGGGGMGGMGMGGMMGGAMGGMMMSGMMGAEPGMMGPGMDPGAPPMGAGGAAPSGGAAEDAAGGRGLGGGAAAGMDE